MGNSLGGTNVQQLHQLEQQLSNSLISVKEKKVLISLYDVLWEFYNVFTDNENVIFRMLCCLRRLSVQIAR